MSEARPLVSVIVPVHNGEAYLEQALESVLMQSYEPIECIVVDDGSSDGTPAVARSFGNRIIYVRQDRHGVAAARNAGARLASGAVLAFLDADDMWAPTKLQRQMALLHDRPQLGLVYCSLCRVDHRGRRTGTVAAPRPEDVVRNILLQRGPGVALAQTGLIPSAVFRAAGGFDERLSTAADSDLALRIVARFEIAALPDALASYRSHPGQLHRDLVAYERDMRLVLRKAFRSGVLPPEVRRQGHRARANLAVTLAYMHHVERGSMSAAARPLLVALAYAPLQTFSWIATAATRRLLRLL